MNITINLDVTDQAQIRTLVTTLSKLLSDNQAPAAPTKPAPVASAPAKPTPPAPTKPAPAPAKPAAPTKPAPAPADEEDDAQAADADAANDPTGDEDEDPVALGQEARALLKRVLTEKGRDQAAKILTKHGAAVISDVEPSEYKALIASLKKVLA